MSCGAAQAPRIDSAEQRAKVLLAQNLLQKKRQREQPECRLRRERETTARHRDQRLLAEPEVQKQRQERRVERIGLRPEDVRPRRREQDRPGRKRQRRRRGLRPAHVSVDAVTITPTRSAFSR